MNRARADNDNQPLVFAGENIFDLLTTVNHCVDSGFSHFSPRLEFVGGNQRNGTEDVNILCRLHLRIKFWATYEAAR